MRKCAAPAGRLRLVQLLVSRWRSLCSRWLRWMALGVDSRELGGYLAAGDDDRLLVARVGGEGHTQPLGIAPQLAFRNIGGEFFDIGAAALAGDLMLADLQEAQRPAGAIARGAPVPHGSGVAIRDIKLVQRLAGLAVEKAAQDIEIRLRNAEKRWRVPRSRADHADEPGRRILGRRGRAIMSRGLRRWGVSTSGERRPQQDGEEALLRADHSGKSRISRLSSPSRGASLDSGGRTPSNESGRPTNDNAVSPTQR